MPSSGKQNIVAIGGSAGSGTVLRRLLGDLPHDLAASIFICTHATASAAELLLENLADSAALPVTRPVDRQPVECGHVYLATADRHLLLIGNTIRLGEGPRENMARPSIDALFRSAALSFGPRVVGVLLTGMLNDGVSGLQAIKSCGGTAVVQHPSDAEFDQMPLGALQSLDVDHVARSSELGSLLRKLVQTDAAAGRPPTEQLQLEVDIAAGLQVGSARLRQLADPSALTCPGCGGVLSEVRDASPLRFRCQIGHAYTADVLASQTAELGEAIRLALRVMEERVTLVERMADDARRAARMSVAELYDKRVEEYRGYARMLREAATSSLRSATAAREQNI